MSCIGVGISAASWSVALVLAVVNTVSAATYHAVTPWMLITLAVGVTATLSVLIERSRELALQVIHADLDGEIADRHLSVVSR